MKTTIDIADPLLRQAKRLAAARGTTLRTVIEDALRSELARQQVPHHPVRMKTHVFRGRGLRPGLSWEEFSTLRDLAYEGRGG